MPSIVMVVCSIKVYQQVLKSSRASVHPTTIVGVRPFEALNPGKLMHEAPSSTVSIPKDTNASRIIEPLVNGDVSSIGLLPDIKVKLGDQINYV